MNINELHEKFQEYGANAKEWKRKCLMLLPEIQKHEVWKKKGFGSIYEYGAKLAGLTHGQIDDALYVLRKIEDKPVLMQVAAQKGLNAVRPIITVAKLDPDFWAQKAKEMSNNTLRTYVKNFIELKRAENNFRDISKTQTATKTITMQIPLELLTKLEKLKGAREWAQLMQEFVHLHEQNSHKHLYNKLESANRASESLIPNAQPTCQKPEPIKTKSRHIPSKIKAYVLSRANNKCEFPNCHKQYDHLHHTNRFALDKSHDPDQIVALCKSHHDLAHKGLIDHEQSAPTEWQISKKVDYTNLNRFIDEQVEYYRRK